MEFTKAIGQQRLDPVRIQASVMDFNYIPEIEVCKQNLNRWLR